MEPEAPAPTPSPAKDAPETAPPVAKLHAPVLPEEFGGSGKAEPTRYGDWEVGGRCTDF